MTKLLCRELSGACSKKGSVIGKGGREDEVFVEKDEKTLEMERLMRDMNAEMPEGMPGMNMYDYRAG